MALEYEKYRKKYKRRKRGCLSKILIVLLILCIFAGGGIYFILHNFKVDNIVFAGTDKYTEDELKEYIFGQDFFSLNMLKLDYDIRNSEKVKIPFIETYEIELDYPDTVKVTMYEKSIVAYVLYKENYMYFDKDGIIVESSKELLEGVPKIGGLEFNSIVLHSVLPVDEEKVFNTILNLSQYLSDYELVIDEIFFNEDYSIVLYMDEITVNLGKGDNLSEKLHELKQMVKNGKLTGLSGTLYMEEFNEDTDYIRFKMDNK